MRRALNWFVVLLSAIFLLGGLTMSGCSSGGTSTTEEPPLAEGMLRAVRDADELESILRRSLTREAAALPAGPVTVTGASLDSFSGTYTVEAGVDELDVVRYDGSYLFVAPHFTRELPDAGELRILRTDADTATAAQVGSIPLPPSQLVLGMYIANQRMFLVTSESYVGPFGDFWADTAFWAPSKFTVQVYDLRTPASPRQLMSATIDGGYVESRRVDDRIIVVSRFTPRVLLEGERIARIAALPLADLLPAITIDGRAGSLVNPRRCFVASEASRSGYPVLTNITTFSLSNPLAIDNVCYDQETDGVYASREALYLTEPRYGSASATRIHKFTLTGSEVAYRGSAEVPGTLWGAGQRDFRMNESEGLLRVMTTQWIDDTSDFSDHHLFVLRQATDRAALDIVARLPNDARPEEIGKPNEALYAVRFVGDRAYAVTFRRIDPLYVIDLSTPTDPRIGGQLLLPGWSELLHPVTENLLLGLGSDGSRVKLELFDTTALDNPQSRGLITLGEITSNSEALYDHHAFTYLPRESADRIAIPAVISTPSPIAGQGVDWTASLQQFEILGKQSASSALLRSAGAVSPPHEPYEIANLSRSFIDGEAVFYIRSGQIFGTFWATPTQVNGPF